MGSILGSAGFLIYSFSAGFWVFVLAEIILRIGHSFVSGADSAMLFDSLKAESKRDKYTREEGRISSVGNFAEAIAGVLGGFLAAISLRTPFYFQFVVAAIAIPASITMLEPKIHAKETIQSISKLVTTIKNSFLSNQNLRIAILLSAITGTATLTFAWFVQPFFKVINLPVEAFGIFWTALNLTVGFSSVFAHKIEIYFGSRKSVLLVNLLLAATYFFSGLIISYYDLIFLFIFYLTRGVATLIFKNYINPFTDSEVRASMLSVRSFIIRLTFAGFGPLLGWITDNLNLKTAFLLAGALYLLSALLVVFPWLKNKN